MFQQSGNKSESAFTLEHLQVIYQALGITACDDQNKAQHLLVLAGIFTRLSSDSVFGVEGDSPFFLRCYALACINQANKLSPNVFPTTADSNVNSWRNKLMGWNDAFSCTAALSGKMYEHCKKNTCDVLDLWPLALRPPLYI